LITKYKFFHILGILSLYTEDLTFLITENESALLKASFLIGWPELIFELYTCTRSFSVYLMVSSHFSFHLSFSSLLHQFFSRPFQLLLLLFLSFIQSHLLLRLFPSVPLLLYRYLLGYRNPFSLVVLPITSV